MWRTGQGDRVLRGGEAVIFQTGLESLVFIIQGCHDFQMGISVFDRMSLPEKLGILEIVGTGLLEISATCTALTAVSEATVAAVYRMFRLDLGSEIDDGTVTLYRQLVANALEELDCDTPDVQSDDLQEWNEHIEFLLDRIVWDRDWDEEFIAPDDPPDEAQRVRDFAGISDDYYSAVPPDPNPTQLERIKKSLDRLCKEEAFRSTE